jgi:hypothetical protein
MCRSRENLLAALRDMSDADHIRVAQVADILRRGNGPALINEAVAAADSAAATQTGRYCRRHEGVAACLIAIMRQMS